ncbi:piggyBac transposable element-derived protein 3-like [Hyposmocoma kahamanoa]|uniref:piggyBac transposable element-derived protein 3-like n=1 Tax=Hyposmocoma kahamanoa TaxID=1477025 RepID=UPI000E6D9473|nr:piggyBac transposable element-derived protein 3-like [Hyposmocoma kahamanoa]
MSEDRDKFREYEANHTGTEIIIANSSRRNRENMGFDLTFGNSPEGERGVEHTSDFVLHLLGDGNDSEIEGLDYDEELPFQRPSNPAASQISSSPIPTPRRPRNVAQNRSEGRRRIWRQLPFNQKQHDYLPRMRPDTVRPMEYFNDYFDDEFFDQAAVCTNNYYMRRTSRILNTNPIELKKLIELHLIMGVIPYPRLYMYWRDGMRLDMVFATIMARERFKTLRSALHVVDSDTAPIGDSNTLWKVQPILNWVKQACDRIERQPGFFSIDEQMLPFSGVCSRGLRQVIKSKPRPQGLKMFVAITHEGLMIDFEVYRGANTPFGDRTLGVGASIILHLSKSIPRGSCIYFDRYFSSIPLLEKLNTIGLHGTATLMMNRLPERKNIDFKPDRRMQRGESQ